MSNPEENGQYSVEDMLRVAQAKARGSSTSEESESREVIVQEDGTKVVKVRRKKRKSNSSNELLSSSEAEKTMHLKLLIFSLIGMVAIALILGGLIAFKTAYYNNPSHIEKLKTSISQRTQSHAELKGFRVSSSSSLCDRLFLEAPLNGNTSYHLDLRKTQLPLNPFSLIKGSFEGTKATADYALLTLENKTIPAPQAGQPDSDFLFTHSGLSIQNANLSIGNPHSKSSLKVLEANAKIMKRENGTQVLLRNGKLRNGRTLPPYLESASIFKQEKTITLQNFLLGDGDVGTLGLTGQMDYATRDVFELNAKVEKLKLEKLHPNLGAVIDGRISSQSGHFLLDTTSGEYEMETSFTCSESGFVLKFFAFLKHINERMGSVNSSYTSFAKIAEGTLTLTNEAYHFTDLNLLSISEIAVRGDLTVGLNSSLSGDLKIGIPPSKIAISYPNVDTDDLTSEQGFVWIPISVYGTTKIPEDNFDKQFKAIVGAW